MKRISLTLGFIAILFSMVSCQKEQSGIIATISRYQGDEKVYIDNDNQDEDDHYACWHSDDAVWIQYVTTQVNDSETTYVSNAAQYSLQAISNNDSRVKVNMTSIPSNGTVLNAFYPASLLPQNPTISSDNTIDINLPAVQTYTEKNGKQVIDAPMVARTTIQNGGAHVEFQNVCSLLKVKLRPNVICYWIEVESDNAPLNGTGTVDFANGTLTMPSQGTTATRKVRLNVNNGTISSNSTLKRRADGIYYIVLPPYMTSTKLKVTVYDNPQTTMIFSQGSVHTLEAGMIGVVNVYNSDSGRGIFTVDARGTKVSFAPGNLTSSNVFETSQIDQGSTFTSIPTNTSSDWTLLTDEEWRYLLARTDNGHTLQIRATVGGQKHGIILLPDNWSSLGCTVELDYNTQNMNTLTITNWEILETYGAVFLPANDNAHNYYWTSDSHYVEFGNNSEATVVNSRNGQHQPYIRYATIVEDHRTN